MIDLSNQLNLDPIAKPANTVPAVHDVSALPIRGESQAPFQTTFEFKLPKGYLDGEGNLHRSGVMRLAKAIDEIVPMRDPRVKSNPAYATVIILSRVILQLGALEEISPVVVEEMFACDLDFLQKFYRHINELEEEGVRPQVPAPDAVP